MRNKNNPRSEENPLPTSPLAGGGVSIPSLDKGRVRVGLNLPKLRFPEFLGAGEWEVKYLNQISTSIFDGTHQTPKYVESGIPFFSVENIVSGKLNKFISRADYLVSTSKNKPTKGDVLVTRIGNIGFSSVVNWDYEFSVYVTLAVIKKNDKFNSNFLHSFMQSEIYQKEIKSKSLLNAVPCKINMDELRNTQVLLPPIPEQQKIADCLSTLDDRIEAENQKLAQLKTHKKALMQQLFPAEGETVPRLRFAEFLGAGEWEVRKLGEISKITTGSSNREDSTIGSGEYTFFDRSQDIRTSNIYLFDGEAVIIAGEGQDFIPKYFMGKFDLHQRTYAIMDFLLCTGIYLFYFIYKFRGYFLEQAVGSTVKSLRLPIFKNMPISLPSSKEQQKIADCLSSLDELIHLQTQKIATLKTHKKGMMQQLFPVIES